jgi:hypothetical protein
MEPVYQTTVGARPRPVRPLARSAPGLRVLLTIGGDSQEDGFPASGEDDIQEDNMNVKQIAAVGVMAAALVGTSATGAFAATATSAATTKSVTASTCLPAGQDDAWPTWTEGSPSRDPGVTVWHDANGWHVRVTHNTIHDRVFSGEIHTTGTLVDVYAVRLEQNDRLALGSGGHTLRFRFNNYGGTDGFDFATHCASYLEFGFASDGHVVPAKRISIGSAGLQPAHDPFVIRRTA